MNKRLVRVVMAGVVIVVAVFFIARNAVDDDETDDNAVTAQILVEYDGNGEAVPSDSLVSVGEAVLTRSAEGLTTRASMGGLTPNGVYTFWLVAYYQGDLEFPADRFVNYGQGVVADENGEAEAVMISAVGDASITGFYVDGLDGVAEFPPLSDTFGSKVRVEIVYHGQAEDAGDDLDAWMADFWTGDPSICANPLGTLGTGAVPEHPYCAGYWAATFPPEEA